MPKPTPYEVAVIFLHPACNMTCSFCITENNFDAMSESQALDLLQTLKAENFKNVVLGGGEPFAWPNDLVRVAKEARRLGFVVQVGTNAVALPPGFEKIDSIDRFVLPLESIDDAVHNRMRFHKERHHELILDCLKKLRSAQKSVTISTIITQVNKDGLKPLALFLKKLNQPKPFIHAWHLYKFLPEGRGGRVNAAALKVTDEEYEATCDTVQALELSFPVYRRKDMYNSKTVDYFWYQQGKLKRASVDREKDILRKMTVPFA